MNGYKIYKHTISLVGLTALILALYVFLTADIQEAKLIDEMIFGTYVSFLFLTILTYRLSMIQSNRLNKAPFAFFVITASLLSMMYFAPEWITEIWQMTLSFFIIQVSQVILAKIELKGKFTPIVKISVLLTAALLITGLVFKLENRVFYSVVEAIAVVTSVLCLIQVLLPQRQA